MSSRFFKNVVSRPPQLIEAESPVTVAAAPATTVVLGSTTMVAVDVTATVTNQLMWRAEFNGALFPASRVRPIQNAQDALTHAEECVYDFLWGARHQQDDDYRIAQAGYDRIAKAARVTKRNAALIIDRLTEKGFLRLEIEADPMHRMARQYRIFSYRAALEEMTRRNRRWVVKSGNGVLFVSPTTVVFESPTTVVIDPPASIVASTTVSPAVPATVVTGEPPLGLADVCRKHGIVLDAVAERIIPKRCRTYDPAASDEEIAHFTELKIGQLQQNRNTGNLAGLLMTAVPEYFVQPAHEVQSYRSRKQESGI